MAIHYSKAGVKKEAAFKLDAAVFGVTVNPELLSLAYRAYLAEGRAVSATTLTRGDVRGGGKKPWKQKGTGRARVGSSRVPHWRGGGVTFGPLGNENYEINLPAKMKHLAVRQALSSQASDNKVVVLEDFTPDGKVKPTVELLAKLKVEGQILLVVPQKDALTIRSTQNLAALTVIAANYLNVFELLNADLVIITEAALPVISNWLAPSANPKSQAKPKAEAKS